MGLFKKKPSGIPMTSFGYQPPGDAVAVGWTCLSCHQGSLEPPRRWPHPCPQCGKSTDAQFKEPRAHDALGVEIRHQLDVVKKDDGGFWATQEILWRFTDAHRRRDGAGVRSAVADMHAQIEGAGPSSMAMAYHGLVSRAVSAGDPDSAADVLVRWLALTDGGDAGANGAVRHNCRNAMESAFAFIDMPGALEHPDTPEITQRVLALSSQCLSVLSPPLQDQVAGLGRV